MNAHHLYVHVPFCARRCVYCDFSIAVRPLVPVQDYLGALARELDIRHAASALRLETLYVGGGTPSRLGGNGVAQLLDVVRRNASVEDGAEVTLEANPEDVTSSAARAWLDAGINRVSLGVQSFQDPVLAWMHRVHDAETAIRAVHVLRDVGIANLSIDLIFAAPSQVERSWERDLETAISLDLPHVSVYGLTVEPHTALGKWVARSDVAEAPEERFESEYLLADAKLGAAGLEHYEVSNYGRAGFHSRHNWAYWQRKPYAGVGPSAHEFDGIQRRWNVGPYAEWIAALAANRDPMAGSEVLDAGQVMAEEVYLNLRTLTGVRLSAQERGFVKSWIDAGWASLDGAGTLRLTPAGWLRLDTLASDLTLRRSRY